MTLRNCQEKNNPDTKSTVVQEEFEDTKGVIRIRKSKKDRQLNGQKKRDKQRPTKRTHKTKNRVTRTPLETGGELRFTTTLAVQHYVIKFVSDLRHVGGFPRYSGLLH